jgi:hypothetical protein
LAEKSTVTVVSKEREQMAVADENGYQAVTQDILKAAVQKHRATEQQRIQ